MLNLDGIFEYQNLFEHQPQYFLSVKYV